MLCSVLVFLYLLDEEYAGDIWPPDVGEALSRGAQGDPDTGEEHIVPLIRVTYGHTQWLGHGLSGLIKR